MEKHKKPSEQQKSTWIKTITMVGAFLVVTLVAKANPCSAAVKKELTDVLKKNPDKEIVVKIENNQSTEKAENFEMMPDTINALDFAVQNVDTYYPDMKEHLDTMINSFRDEEHRSATIKLLNEMVKNISDPAQKTGAIIYALERRVFSKSDFAKKYDSQITDETFDYMDIFRIEYDKRFDVYYVNLLANIEQLKAKIERKQNELQGLQQELEKGRQELETIISKFSPEDVKNNTQIKNLVLQTEQRFKNNNFIPSAKVQKLFNATK
jgi:hypothetical protein